MDRYKKYMDDITVPDELHERFREPKKARRKLPSRVWAGAAAACAVLGLVLLPGTGSGEKSTSSAQTTAAGADREWAAGGFDEEGTERIADDERTEAGAARPESAEAEDFMTFLPAMEAADFSGWEKKETFGDIVLNAEGSWALGTKKISVVIRRGTASEEHDTEEMRLDSARREIQIIFWDGDYQAEYFLSGVSEKEAKEIRAVVASQRSKIR